MEGHSLEIFSRRVRLQLWEYEQQPLPACDTAVVSHHSLFAPAFIEKAEINAATTIDGLGGMTTDDVKFDNVHGHMDWSHMLCIMNVTLGSHLMFQSMLSIMLIQNHRQCEHV